MRLAAVRPFRRYMLDRMNRLVVFSALALTLSSAHPPPFVPASQPCGAVATFADARTPVEIRHVSLKGNDTDGAGSATRPFRTIARAARSISPGTAIYLHAGTYPGATFLTALRGTAAQPIWIMGAPGEARPVIAGGSQGLYLTRPRYVVLQNLEIRDTADNGINVDDAEEVANPDAARFVLFRDLDIHDTGKQPSGVANCLKMAGVNDFFVLGSSFARCGNGPGSGAVGVDGVGVHRGRLSFNRFIANGFGGVQFKGASRDIEIRSNFFQNTGWRGVNMGGSTGRAVLPPASGRLHSQLRGGANPGGGQCVRRQRGRGRLRRLPGLSVQPQHRHQSVEVGASHPAGNADRSAATRSRAPAMASLPATSSTSGAPI